MDVTEALPVEPITSASICQYAEHQQATEEKLNWYMKRIAKYIQTKHPELTGNFARKDIEEEAKNVDFYEVMFELVKYYDENEKQKEERTSLATKLQQIQRFFTLKVYSEEVDTVLRMISKKIEDGDCEENGTIHLHLDDDTDVDHVMKLVQHLLNKQGHLCSVRKKILAPSEWVITPCL